MTNSASDKTSQARNQRTLGFFREEGLYSRFEKPSGFVKVLLQMLIGAGIVLLLALKLVDRYFDGLALIRRLPHLANTLSVGTLDLVGRGLAYAAGVELACMLFTPGPDEAIEPLIAGLASAILLAISNLGDPKLEAAATIGLYVVILAGLFLMREIFLGKRRSPP